MARLPRIVGKIFGSSAGPNQIGVFGSLFAGSEATTTNPATAQSLSNWLTGWFGAAIDGNAPAIEDMNAAFFVHSHQIAYILQSGVPEWNEDTVYFTGNICNIDGNLYISLTDDNEANDPETDTTNWKLLSFEATGTGKDYWGVTLPAGYIWASGKTIGSAASGATERANADTFNLYKMLWDNYDNTLLPIYDSSGVATIRGATAISDFTANKRLTVIDKRGRASIGKDDMGGTSANRITNFNGDVLGNSGGEENHTLTVPEMPSHTHTQNPHTHSYTRGNTDGSGASAGVIGANYGGGISTETGAINNETAVNQSTGGDGAHNNIQPSIVCNYIIKL